MKAILMSIRPQYVAKILNKEKTIEVRKKFPKDYVGWVYIYCTKDKKRHLYKWKHKNYIGFVYGGKDYTHVLNGKVVARFWCDKVEEIKYHFGYYNMGEWTESYILENSCLSAKELDDYLQASKEYDETKVSRVYGCAIHITKLEIFDKPKDISEFSRMKSNFHGCENKCYHCEWYASKSCIGKRIKSLTRAPQSWCYIEV